MGRYIHVIMQSQISTFRYCKDLDKLNDWGKDLTSESEDYPTTMSREPKTRDLTLTKSRILFFRWPCSDASFR